MYKISPSFSEHATQDSITPVKKQITRNSKIQNQPVASAGYSLQIEGRYDKHAAITDIKLVCRQFLSNISLVSQTVKAEVDSLIKKLAGNNFAGENIVEDILDFQDFTFGDKTKALLIKHAGNADYDSGVSRFNAVTLKEIDKLTQTEDALKIFEFMLSYKRINTENAPYEFSDSDIVKVLQSEKIKKYVIRQINENKSLSKTNLEDIFPEFRTDIKEGNIRSERNLNYKAPTIAIKGINNEEELNRALVYSPEFKTKITQKIPAGETGSINGKLYCNSGSEFFEIKMTKETFDKLFPIKERYNTAQGDLEDCWLVSALGALMDSPRGRSYLYKLFKEEKNGDILITFPDEENNPVKFKNGRLNPIYPISFYINGLKPGMCLGRPGLSGCEGLKMIEEAFAVHKTKDKKENETTNDINKIFFMGKKMRQQLDGGGWSGEAIHDIAGSQNVLFKNFVSVVDVPDILDKLTNAIKNSDNILTFCTKDKVSNEKYGIIANHEYRITGLDVKNKTITISNPWQDANTKTIPVYDWLNYTRHATIAMLK